MYESKSKQLKMLLMMMMMRRRKRKRRMMLFVTQEDKIPQKPGVGF